jgi:hypothetical protein
MELMVILFILMMWTRPRADAWFFADKPNRVETILQKNQTLKHHHSKWLDLNTEPDFS